MEKQEPKLHCDYRPGTPAACPRRDGNVFYLVNFVQRPLCAEHARQLAVANDVRPIDGGAA